MKSPALICHNCKSRGQSLFSFCRLTETEQINSTKSVQIFRKGDYIFLENRLPNALYCINSGTVKISKLSSNGKEQIVRIAHGGNFLGYRSLILKSRYTYSAIALEECRVCVIPKTDFFALLRNNNDFYQALMEMICREADEVETKLSDMAHKPVRSRIAEALLLLANSSTNEEHIISLTREDLASFVGTVKETAIRVISELRDANIISIDKRKIRILNPQMLTHISNVYD
jgi:CRP-like cAMP-binding protein